MQHLIRVGEVIDHVPVQLPSVGIDESDGEEGQPRCEPWSGGAQELSATPGVRFDRGIQKIRSDVTSEHQKDYKEPAMQIRPQQRQRNQPQQQLRAPLTRASDSGAHSVVIAPHSGHDRIVFRRWGYGQGSLRFFATGLSPTRWYTPG